MNGKFGAVLGILCIIATGLWIKGKSQNNCANIPENIPPVVTNLPDGGVHIDRLGPGESATFSVSIPIEEIFGTDGDIRIMDLLDAIEQVESGGDPNAVGDIYISDNFPGWNCYPSNWSKTDRGKIGELGMPEYNGWYWAPGYPPIKIIGKGRYEGVMKAEIGEAVGSFQINRIYVDDVNRIMEAEGHEPNWTYNDRWDPDYSRSMAMIYMGYWHNEKFSYRYFGRRSTVDLVTAERLARIHNGGPCGNEKDSTLPYWQKVRKLLLND